MSLSSLLGRFRHSGHKAARLTIVIQSHVIYLLTEAMVADHQQALMFPITDGWESALKSALTSGDYSGMAATVVCCSNYYHIYQLDKPDIPQQEWPAALPFLLKDMSGERVTDIIADAALLPDGKKIQAYVLKRATLNQLLTCLHTSNIHLERIIPEDAAWGSVKKDLSGFMLLHRGPKGSFKIAAFVEQQNRFHRTLRNIIVPVTGQAASALQLDSLALELQRSIDYLSSQLRNTDLHQLFLCCDEEEQEELLHGLDERLNVKVLPLVADASRTSGEMLAQVVPLLSAEGINLYPAYLKPKKQTFTLKNVAAVWGIVAVLMLAGYGYYAYSLHRIESDLTLAEQRSERQLAELKHLQEQVKKHKTTPSKLLAAERFEADIQAKEASLAAISHYDQSLQAGYSGVMSALAKLSDKNISVAAIDVNNTRMNLSGLARTPGAIPAWVKRFNSEMELTGRTFEKLNISRNEGDMITFELTTQAEGEQ